MKFTFLAFFIFISTFSKAQIHNFEKDEKENIVVWKKIFSDSVSTFELEKFLKVSGRFNNVEATGNIINFDFDYDWDKLKKFGHKRNLCSVFASLGGNCKGVAEFKEGKYRVTVQKITIAIPYQTERENIGKSLLRKDGTYHRTTRFIDNGLDALDKYFTETFTYIESKNDW